jgi:hypothetical protein
MADFNFVVLPHLLNPSFLYGLVGGFSIAWLFLKSRFKMHRENTVLSPEYSSTCGEVGCRSMIVKLTCIVCGKDINYKLPCFSLSEMIVSNWFSLFEQT